MFHETSESMPAVNSRLDRLFFTSEIQNTVSAFLMARGRGTPCESGARRARDGAEDEAEGTREQMQG